jgi:hypothetical protein
MKSSIMWGVAAVLGCSGLSCGGGPPLGSCNGSASKVAVGLDPSIASIQTSTGYLVPLVIEAAMPCLEGVAHATVISSAGQFSSTGMLPMVPSAMTSMSTDAGADSGTDAAVKSGKSTGGGGMSGTAAATSGSASTTVTLTQAGVKGEVVGFTTLQLSGAQLTTRVQVSVGDVSACETIIGLVQSVVDAAVDGGALNSGGGNGGGGNGGAGGTHDADLIDAGPVKLVTITAHSGCYLVEGGLLDGF